LIVLSWLFFLDCPFLIVLKTDIQEWTIKKGQSRNDNQEWTIKKGQSRKDNQERTIKNGQLKTKEH
jgi:hypothetical protein